MASSRSRAERVRELCVAATRFVASTRLAEHARARRAGLSLHSADATVLDLLRVHGPLTPRELARQADISSSGTITAAIDRLERAGWTTRTPCRVDRRKVFITLTDTGHDTGTELKQALAGYSDDQLRTISQFLGQVGRPCDETGTG